MGLSPKGEFNMGEQSPQEIIFRAGLAQNTLSEEFFSRHQSICDKTPSITFSDKEDIQMKEHLYSNQFLEWSTGTNLFDLFGDSQKIGSFDDFDVVDEDYKDNNSRRKGRKHHFFYIKIPKVRKDYLLKTHKALFIKHMYKKLRKFLKYFGDGVNIHRPSQNFIRDTSIQSNKMLLTKTLDVLFASCSKGDNASKKKELEVNKINFDLVKSKLNTRILSEATSITNLFSTTDLLLMEGIVKNYSIEQLWTIYLKSAEFIQDTERVIKKKNYAEIREFDPILYYKYACYGWNKRHNNKVHQTKSNVKGKKIFKVVTIEK